LDCGGVLLARLLGLDYWSDSEVSDYPTTGQKFRAGGHTYKWVPYKKAAQPTWGKGRFQRMKWSGPKEDGDFFRWVNEAPPEGLEWEFIVTKRH